MSDYQFYSNYKLELHNSKLVIKHRDWIHYTLPETIMMDEATKIEELVKKAYTEGYRDGKGEMQEMINNKYRGK